MGETLLELLSHVEFVHFAEMGIINEDASADIGIVEGSVSTQQEIDRINRIRKKSKRLVTIGACATSGGIQSLRNDYIAEHWLSSVYKNISTIDFKEKSQPISAFVNVDYQLWGCPINARDLVNLLNDILRSVKPRQVDEKVCLECKRRQNVCTLVSIGQCCMGVITRGGCGALCPSVESACYGCFGPAETSNVRAVQVRFVELGLNAVDANRRIRFIHSQQGVFDALKT